MTKRSLLIAASVFSCVSWLTLPAFAENGDSGYSASAYGNVATNLETRLSAVEDQLRALTGKVEQLDYATRRIDEALQRLQADYDMRLTKLESAPPPAAPPPSVPPTPTGAPDTAENEPSAEPVNGSLGGVKVRGDQVTGGVVAPKTPPLPKKPDDYGLTAQEHYDLAFGQLRQADYDKAEKTFKSFLDKYGTDKLADNAKYWYAETFYVRAKFGDAALAFADAYQQNPKGTKAPDSLLKLAMSLAAMEKTKDACDALTALKSKYPNAPSTVRSRTEQERSRLKCK